MSGYTPLYPWANGRASGLSLNATRFLGELDHMGDYVEGFVGGGLSIQNDQTVVTKTICDMSNRQECLWIVTLGNNGVKLEIVGMAAGDSVTLVLKQDAVGNRVLGDPGLPAALWDDGANPQASQTLTASGIDIYGFFHDGTNTYGFNSGQGFA